MSKQNPQQAIKKFQASEAAIRSLLTFDSMQQCASAMKIPLNVLKKAKRDGCPAFKSNRVFVGEFLEWFFAQGEEIKSVDPKSRLMIAQAEKVELENKVRKRDLCEWTWIERWLNEKIFGRIINAADAAPNELDRQWVERVLKPTLRSEDHP